MKTIIIADCHGQPHLITNALNHVVFLPHRDKHRMKKYNCMIIKIMKEV